MLAEFRQVSLLVQFKVPTSISARKLQPSAYAFNDYREQRFRDQTIRSLRSGNEGKQRGRR